jgi:hypothetical protein
MPSRPQAFKRTEAKRVIRALEEAGHKLKAVVLEGNTVIFQIDDSETPSGAALDEWKAKHADKVAGN